MGFILLNLAQCQRRHARGRSQAPCLTRHLVILTIVYPFHHLGIFYFRYLCDPIQTLPCSWSHSGREL